MVTSSTPTSITLTWEQTEESADAVDRYEINYEFSVIECSEEGGSFGPVPVTVNNASLRRYTLNSSPSTPVQEDSRYFITLTAVNSVARSEAAAAIPSHFTTPYAGKLLST